MCGVFGVFNNSLASHMTFLGLHALQHRGQESAGIAVSDGYDINLRTGEGLVTKALKEKDLQELKGDIAIGHVRYSTAGGSNPKNIQPFFAHFYGGSFAIAHNGNLVNAEQIREDLEKNGAIFRSTSDTEVFIHLIAKAKEPPPSHIMLHENDRDFLPLIFSAMNKVKGAYSLLILREKQLIAVRDPYGFRPLVLGKNRSGSYFIASETCALDIVDAEYLRDIKPGEVFVIDDSGMRSYFPLDHADNPRKCIFEFVYFARPDSMIFQDWVYEIRKEMGRTLAREFKVDADYVVPVLDSGLLAAKGYSEESGIPLEIGLIRNHYVGRSFIQPKQEIRDLSVKLKLNPVRQVVEGKRLVVIDDSLVRGTTSKKIVNMLRKAGAKEIHFLLSSPPVISPCYYGIDTPTKEELIAANMSIEQIRDYIGVDSLYYLSLEGMIGAANKFRQKGFFAQHVLQETTLCSEADMPNLDKIHNKIRKEGLDSFFFTGSADIFYMTYFSSTNAFVLLTDRDRFFITDGRYYEAAKEKLKDWNVILLGENDKKHIDHLKEILKDLGGKKIGFQEDKVTVSFFKKLTEDRDFRSAFVGYEGFLNDIRMVKTEKEIEIIKEAVKKTDIIFSKIVQEIKDLKTELDVRRRIIDLIFQMKGTGESFPSIVASGEHSAIPHYETSDHRVKWNSPLLIDMGMRYKGYCSDFTRTLFLGNVDPELKKVYEIVKEAHLSAVEKVKAGLPVKEIDLAARDVIQKSGYGDYFIHSTGHGVGIEIHEAPRISKNSEEIIRENTVFTIEPGIYLPGKGGVRLENIVVCRKDKAEVLTTTALDILLVQ